MAEERNLTRAARKAFISQPTLTNYINRLEEQLGVKLFDRSVTPIEITRAGALYIEQMKKIQLAETNLRNELRILGSMETVFHLGIGATRGRSTSPSGCWTPAIPSSAMKSSLRNRYCWPFPGAMPVSGICR